MTLPRLAASRVVSALRSGSSLPVVVDSPGGRFVTKLRGAAQGVTSLIAEIIVAELAQVLGLPVPDRALMELPPEVPSDDAGDELRQLLDASAGLNLGFRELQGARELRLSERDQLDDEFAARLLWLDGLVMNPDRSEQNPNLLLWNRQPWLIDHGAALGFQHDWARVTEDSAREPGNLERHLLAARSSLLLRHDARLAATIARETLTRAVDRVPSEFLRAAFPGDDEFRLRAGYQAFLWKRLKAPRPFVTRPGDVHV